MMDGTHDANATHANDTLSLRKETNAIQDTMRPIVENSCSL